MYQPNPLRGCGTKQPDAFYAETGKMYPGGGLHPWVWCLGDGLARVPAVQVPPRRIIECNPAATILEKSVTPNPYAPHNRVDEYDWLLERMPEWGLADHVGANHYTAHSFAQEVQEMGASRRIPRTSAKRIAELIARHGPLAVVFTHNQIPRFGSDAEREEALDLALTITWHDSDYQDHWHPSWTDHRWGMYARQGQEEGNRHYMLIILKALQRLNRVRPGEDDLLDYAATFFLSLRYTEQVFGLGWITAVSYTLPKEPIGEDKLADLNDIVGLNIIDLEKREAV